MKGLTEYAGDADDEEDLKRHKKRIMHVVARKGATYPSEIARHMPLQPNEVAPIIHDLLESGHLQEINVTTVRIDPRLRRRFPDMWRRGETGFDTFRQRHWVGLADNKILYHTDGRVTDPYGREIHDVDETFDETGSMLEYGAEA